MTLWELQRTLGTRLAAYLPTNECPSVLCVHIAPQVPGAFTPMKRTLTFLCGWCTAHGLNELLRSINEMLFVPSAQQRARGCWDVQALGGGGGAGRGGAERPLPPAKVPRPLLPSLCPSVIGRSLGVPPLPQAPSMLSQDPHGIPQKGGVYPISLLRKPKPRGGKQLDSECVPPGTG